MEQKWELIEANMDRVVELSKKLNIDPFIIKILFNRGIDTEEDMLAFWNPSMSDIRDWRSLKCIDEAIELLSYAIDSDAHIRIFGDYDIDGVMSTYILHQAILRAVREAGSGSIVDYQLPHRIYDGYGLNTDMVDKAYADGVELIITCDNGIAAIDAIAKAKSYGMTVVVTDHHEIRYEMDATGAPLIVDGHKVEILPDADAVVDPHRSDDTSIFKNICGGMVAWKVMQGLYDFYGISPEEAFEYIEYAGFATVGDIMPLIDENRVAVYYGLKRLQYSTVRNIGLKELIKATGLSDKVINSTSIGYILGPCVNATGRLDSAQKGIELLEAEDQATAERLALELVALNEERKSMTEAGAEAAKALAGKSAAEGGYADDKVLVIYLEGIHESIAGIIAGRIREAFGKPTFVITDTDTTAEDGIVKGSGRSIEAYNMFEHMVQVQDVFTKFGGHPMAAGFSLKKADIDSMRRRLNELCGLTDEDLIEKLYIDLEMPLYYMNEARTALLDKLEPFGEANRKPRFMTTVSVAEYKRFGKILPQTHMSLKLLEVDKKGVKHVAQGKVFSRADDIEPLLKDAVDNNIPIRILYYPGINDYNGRISVEMFLQGWKKG